MSNKIFKRLAFPILIIIGLLAASFLVPVLYPDYDEIINYLKDENNKVIAAPPFSAEEMPLLGSDRLGRNFLLILIAGAKYTIFAALAIAALRMIFGFLFAVLYTFLPGSFTRTLKGLGESFQYIPLAIVVFALLAPLEGAFQGDALPSSRYFFIQLAGIAAITIPSLGIYLGEEMKIYLKQEFIEVSKIMGASRFHLVRKHLLPQFLRHSIVLFSEQVSQALSLLIQLGVILMALGGIKVAEFAIGPYEPSNPVYFSETNEWAATISMNIQQVFSNPLLVVVPLTLFSILILCINSISASLKKALIDSDVTTKRSVEKDKQPEGHVKISEDLFTFKN
ncbi:ABC transporter permease subunit [Bacillus salacetis]|uniref:ABC transporter permease subunit n=1 Tax=Bacillus salacetis TaxID=2315464 RepID=A0A3A1R592_9BACI|nr:ABC transporter permease subunit [Bacillus salacetis]RIW38366.1 ABC transporter permease subunit [Bacillus salacetis]